MQQMPQAQRQRRSEWGLSPQHKDDKDDTASSSSSSSSPNKKDSQTPKNSRQNDKKEELATSKTMVAGAVAGMVSRVFCHPIDTLKSKLQVVKEREGLARMASRTLRGEGLRGLYAGFPVVCLGSAPANCLYFTSYEWSKGRLEELEWLNPTAAHLCAGFAAEAFSCVLWVPIDVSKERMQVQSVSAQPTRYHSSWHCLRQIAQEEGIRGVYRGYGATLASFGPFSAIYLASYEQYKKRAIARWGKGPNKDLPFPAYVAGGALAGAFASFLTTPLDMAKLRLQVQRSGSGFHFHYANILHGMRDIWHTEGARGLFKGVGARMLFQAPLTAITMSTFESVKNLLRRDG